MVSFTHRKRTFSIQATILPLSELVLTIYIYFVSEADQVFDCNGCFTGGWFWWADIKFIALGAWRNHDTGSSTSTSTTFCFRWPIYSFRPFEAYLPITTSGCTRGDSVRNGITVSYIITLTNRTGTVLNLVIDRTMDCWNGDVDSISFVIWHFIKLDCRGIITFTYKVGSLKFDIVNCKIIHLIKSTTIHLCVHNICTFGGDFERNLNR